MNPADRDEVVSQFCAMTRARPDEVSILSQFKSLANLDRRKNI